MISTWILESSKSLSLEPTTVSLLFQNKRPNKLSVTHIFENTTVIYQITTHFRSNLLYQALILHQNLLKWYLILQPRHLQFRPNCRWHLQFRPNCRWHRQFRPNCRYHRMKSTNSPFHCQNYICFIPNSVTYPLIPPFQFYDLKTILYLNHCANLSFVMTALWTKVRPNQRTVWGLKIYGPKQQTC